MKLGMVQVSILHRYLLFQIFSLHSFVSLQAALTTQLLFAASWDEICVGKAYFSWVSVASARLTSLLAQTAWLSYRFYSALSAGFTSVWKAFKARASAYLSQSEQVLSRDKGWTDWKRPRLRPLTDETPISTLTTDEFLERQKQTT
jgi:hypothetical protein